MNTVSVTHVMGRVGSIMIALEAGNEAEALDQTRRLYYALEFIHEARGASPGEKPRKRKPRRKKGKSKARVSPPNSR